MKRYYDLHDKRVAAKLEIGERSEAATAPVEKLKKYFNSEDIREVTLSQYRRLCIQYNN
ncbi:hypothetical protein [uncultured Robinsoniella sp.]|uniref:hypothetical protein n=1 Tax=uncultured Robinsoniella sp. TaxID=904190 RepID=UPI002064DC49|nr:MAG TPA: hypothetical protein [Caudoviricetes sp.]